MFEYTQGVEKFQMQNTCLDQYFFDMKEQPIAFSQALIDVQAKYVADKILQVV